MPMPILRRPVPLLLALAGFVPAVELPVVAVTVSPDGAIVERAGTMPAGDTVVEGLPLALTAAGVAVTVTGVEAPRWQLRVEEPANAGVPEELRREQAAADAAFAAAELAVARAGLRRGLAEAALAGEAVAGDPLPALPTAAVTGALGAFLADNQAKAYAEEVAALADREAAQARLAAVGERIAAALPRAAATARLAIPDGAGRAVRVVYRMGGARWEPSYRLRIAGGVATLQPEARIHAPVDDAWGAAPITCVTRHADGGLLLPDLSIPQLGVADTVADLATPREPALGDGEMGGEGAFMAIGAGGGSAGVFGSRSGGGKKRALGRFGGSKGSESAVEAGTRGFQAQQREDGSWADGPDPVATTALVTLTFLGAGYDHRMPSKYKQTVAKAVAWLAAQPSEGGDLADLALVTTALAEAYGMSNDPELRQPCESRYAALATRVAGGGEAAAWINRGGAFAGPEILVWLSMAAKSCQAAGMAPHDDLRAAILALRGQARGAGDPDESRLSLLLTDMFQGGAHPAIDAVEAQRWAAQIPAWFRRGRSELIGVATLVCFQAGGEAWQRWNAVSRDFLVGRQGADGLWDLPHPGGRLAGSAQCTLAMEVYYRYLPVAGAKGPAMAVQEEQLGDALAAAQGWPVRWVCPPVALAPGRISTVPLAPIALAGGLAWRAIPVSDPTVWRSLPTRNPLAQPLPAGRCTVELDGVDLATLVLPFVPPGAPVTIPLGAEEGLRVVREPTTTSDDGVRSRVLTVELAFRLEAPAGFAGTVTMVEPLPQPRGDAIELTLRDPALKGAELQARLDSDPYWRATLRAGQTTTWGWKLRYSTSVRPSLEYLP